MDGEADLAAAPLIEIGMAGEETFGFGCRRVAKAVDVVMAVALGMGDTDQRAEREVLLYGEARLAGEILAGNEMPRTLRAPLRRAGGVDDGFVEALAGFRGNAAIAERARGRGGVTRADAT